jgi:serine phosphatase RsbU (regulator of sigma subunit)
VTLLEAPAPAPPLGLLALGETAGAQLSCALQPDDQLLLYTDGVTEARDSRRAFYPLPERVSVLAAKAAAGQAAGRVVLKSVSGASRPGLLDLLRADLHRHVGAPIDDDAAMLLVQAPAAWPAGRVASGPTRMASAS